MNALDRIVPKNVREVLGAGILSLWDMGQIGFLYAGKVAWFATTFGIVFVAPVLISLQSEESLIQDELRNRAMKPRGVGY